MNQTTRIFSAVLCLATLMNCQAQSHNNQQVTGNNNRVTQLNVTKIMKEAAAESGSPESWNRMLLPGNLPTPHVECEQNFAAHIPAGGFKVYYGGGVSYCPEEGCDLVSAEFSSSPGVQERASLLRVDRVGTNLVVSAKIYTEDGRIAAKLDRGKMYKSELLVPYVERPDPSTFIIVNDHGDPLVTVRYLNKTAISMEGTFYKPYPEMPGHPPLKVTLTQSRVIFPGNNTVEGACMAGMGASASAFAF